MTSLPLDAEIAQAAARMVVEEGLEYGPAKRRAVPFPIRQAANREETMKRHGLVSCPRLY